MFTTYMKEITSTEVYDTESFINENFYFPEEDPFSINFQSAGYTSSLFLLNGQEILSNFSVHFCFIGLLLLVCLIKKCCPKIVAKVQHFLFWNGTIRLFIYVYLDMILFSLLNLHEKKRMEKLSMIKSIEISNWLSISCLTSGAFVPLTLLACYIKQRKNLQEDTGLIVKTGSFILGARLEKFGSAVATPMLYFARSVILSLSLVYFQDKFWLQLLISMSATMTVAMFLQRCKPFDNWFENHLQTFNQIITVCILYLMMCFTDFVSEPEMRYNLGYAQMGLLGILVLLTGISVLVSECKTCKLHAVRQFNRRCRRRRPNNVVKTSQMPTDLMTSKVETVVQKTHEKDKISQSSLSESSIKNEEEEKKQPETLVRIEKVQQDLNEISDLSEQEELEEDSTKNNIELNLKK